MFDWKNRPLWRNTLYFLKYNKINRLKTITCLHCQFYLCYIFTRMSRLTSNKKKNMKIKRSSWILGCAFWLGCFFISACSPAKNIDLSLILIQEIQPDNEGTFEPTIYHIYRNQWHQDFPIDDPIPGKDFIFPERGMAE